MGCVCPIVDGMRKCDRHGVQKGPRHRALCRQGGAYWTAWEEGRGPGQTRQIVGFAAARPTLGPNLPCVHRGDVLRNEECRTCPKSSETITVAVSRCDLHGECSPRRAGLEGVAACNVCPDRLEPAAPRVAAPDPFDSVTACVTEYLRPAALDRLKASLAARFPSLRVDVEPTGGNLSAARNRLAARCRTPFYFMLEEDFEVDRRTDLAAMLDVLGSDPGLGGVGAMTYEPTAAGTAGRGKTITWGNDFVRLPNAVHVSPARTPAKRTPNGTTYQPCDLILNFGLFRTETLRAVRFDERLPVQEHEDWFYRAWLDGRWGFAHLRAVMAVHHRDRPGKQYAAGRNRRFDGFLAAIHGGRLTATPPPAGSRPVPNVVVLTVGRSGSTLAVKMAVRAFGFQTGELDTEYHEERRVRAVNEAFWRGRPFDPVAARRAVRPIPEPWIIKDPRFRRTLGLWTPIFEPYKPLLVHLTKDPAAVKASYERAGWGRSYDPADADRCLDAYEAWPFQKLTVRYEDLGAAAVLFDPAKLAIPRGT